MTTQRHCVRSCRRNIIEHVSGQVRVILFFCFKLHFSFFLFQNKAAAIILRRGQNLFIYTLSAKVLFLPH